MLNTESAELVLIDCHTLNPRVFWRGVEVPGVKSVNVSSEDGQSTVSIELHDNPVYHEMRGQGIRVVRVGSVE